MVDMYCDVGGDLVVDPNGGITPATGWDEIRQQMGRFLITNPSRVNDAGQVFPADYIWHPQFGLGLPSYLGSILTPTQLTAMENAATQAALSNPSVAQNPQPVVTFSATQHQLLFLILVYLVNQTPGTEPVGMAYEVSQ